MISIKVSSITILQFLFFSFFSVNGIAQVDAGQLLIGKWELTSRQKTGTLDFINAREVLFHYPNGTTEQKTYEVDVTKNPITLDIHSGEGMTSKLLPGIIEFIDSNTVRYKIFPYGSRNGSFELEKNTSVVIMRRVASSQ